MSDRTAVPVISVIIPVFNGEATIDAQLDALAAQPFDLPWELLIADNGSRDRTREVVLARRARFPAPLRVLDAGARKGVAHPRNAGVLAARGAAVAFCDADDVVGPNWLAGAHRGLQEHDVVGGPIRRLTEPFDPDSELLGFDSVSDGEMVGSNIAIRRDIYLAAGGFEEAWRRYGREDYEFGVRLRSHGARFGRDPDMLNYYRLVEDQWKFTRKIYASGRSDVDVWRRHPEVFPGRLGRGAVLRESLSLPWNLLRAGRSGGHRRMARTVVDLAAHARELLPPQRPMPPPVLIEETTPPREIDGDAQPFRASRQ
ncbi:MULTISPECIES: glycosyltransferase [unclassified Brachybacterium]|uniref:glycosyltransferase n=1 Tax=unclassified Brachybacterium TaxID=2623841 RepID=UPI003620B8A3